MRKSGIAFHCHHDDLAEYVHDYDERVEYIKANKPVEEQELRLRLFKLIPNDMLPPECDKARVEWDKAQAEWDKARAECDKAQAECDKARAERDKARAERDKAQAEWDKARVERDKARVEWDKAWVEWDKAWAEWDRALAKCMPALERLHKKLCPNCPWNGYTIFTRHSPGQGLQKGGG